MKRVPEKYYEPLTEETLKELFAYASLLNHEVQRVVNVLNYWKGLKNGSN